MKNQLTSVLYIIIMLNLLLMVTGCDEGMNMAGQVIGPTTTEPGTNPATNGEIKEPEPTPEPKPGEQKQQPTVTINSVVQADDGTITVSGASTHVPEGAKVTVVLGDDVITVKTTVDKDGAWTATVPPKKTAKLSPGTVAVKATAKKITTTSSFEIAPPEPTLTINTVTPADDGTITVSGTSTELTEGEIVTITIGDSITVTTTTDATGAWSVTIPAAKAAGLATGTVAVKATVKKITTESSFERTPATPPTPTPPAATPATEIERIQRDIITDVAGEGYFTEYGYSLIIAEYGSLFDVETDIGRATFRRFVVYDYKKLELASSGDFDNDALLDQYFEEAYGMSADFARWLVFEIYLPETGEEISGLWQTFDIAMEYLLLQIANPDATEEELLELLKESIRAGNISIAA